MPLKIIGNASWMGIGGTVVVAGILSAGKTKLVDIGHSADIPGGEANDGDGNTFSESFARRRDSLTLTLIITDDGGSPTKASVLANAKLPAGGTLITIAGTDSWLDGDWNAGRQPGLVMAVSDGWKLRLPVTRKGPLDGSGNPTALAAFN